MVKLELPHGTYEGEVLDGKASGKGKLIYKNGENYEGDVLDGKPHGIGKLIYKSGGIYEGEFNNGVKEGNGKYINKNENVMSQGKFKNDTIQEGTVTTSSLTQTGKFIDGVMYDEDGSIKYHKLNSEYKGGIKNAKLDGKGKYEFNGISETIEDKNSKGFYEGDFKDNKKHGKGTLTQLNTILKIQRTYIGDFRDNLKHGKGKEYIFLDVNEEDNFKKPGEDEHASMIEGEWLIGYYLGGNDALYASYFKREGARRIATLSKTEKSEDVFTKCLLNVLNIAQKKFIEKDVNINTLINLIEKYQEKIITSRKISLYDYKKMAKFSRSKFLSDELEREYCELYPEEEEPSPEEEEPSSEEPSPLRPRRLSFSGAGKKGGSNENTIFTNTLGENYNSYMMDGESLETILYSDKEDFSFYNQQKQKRTSKIFRNPPSFYKKERKDMWFLEQYLLRLFGLNEMDEFRNKNFLINFTNERYPNIYYVMNQIMNISPIQLVEFQERENVDEIDFGAFRLEFFNRLNDEIRNTFFEKIPGTNILQLKEYSTTNFHKEFPFISKEVGLHLLGLIIARLLSTDNGTIYSDSLDRDEMIKPFRLLLPIAKAYSNLFTGEIHEGGLVEDKEPFQNEDRFRIKDPIPLITSYMYDNQDTWNTIFKNKENLEYFDSMFGDFVDYDELIKLLPGVEKNEDFKDEDTMNNLHIIKKMCISCFIYYFENVFKHKEQLLLFLNGFSSIFTKFGPYTIPYIEQMYNPTSLLSTDFHTMYTPNEFSMELFKRNVVYEFKGLNELTKQTKEWFDKFIEEIDETSAKRILLFCCNQRVIPLEEYKVIVDLYDQPGRLPQAHVCFNTIDLYGSENYETFKSNLLMALASSEGFVAGKKMKQCPNVKKHKSTLLQRLEAVKQKLNKKKRGKLLSKKRNNSKKNKKRGKFLSKNKKKKNNEKK